MRRKLRVLKLSLIEQGRDQDHEASEGKPYLAADAGRRELEGGRFQIEYVGCGLGYGLPEGDGG